MTDPGQLNQKGMSCFFLGHYQKAHELFMIALQRVDPNVQPSLYFNLNYNLAKTLQHKGEHSQAIRIFKALRLEDHLHYIRYDHGIASSNCKLGNYHLATQQFIRITKRYNHCRKDYFYFDSKFGIAICHAMLKNYRESLDLLRMLIVEDPGNNDLYWREIEHLQMLLLDELDSKTSSSVHSIDSYWTTPKQTNNLRIEGDQKLCKLISTIIPKFSEIKLPIKAIFLEKSKNNPPSLRKLGASNMFVPIAQSHRDLSGHVLIYNKEFWCNASDSAIRGNLAHELMHRAWEDSGADKVFFSWTKDTLTYSCLERIVDNCVLAKGFAGDLYAAKKYVQQNSNERNSIGLSLGELSRFLHSASTFEMAGSGSNLTKFEVPTNLAGEMMGDLQSIEQANLS